MQVFGNVEALKRAIEKKYSEKIKEAEKERDEQLAEIDRELKKKLELLRSHMKTITNADVKKAYSRILSEERFKAKREFEEKREGLIDAVIKKAEKKSKEIAHSNRYIDYVKANIPKGNFILVGDDEYYRKYFPELVINKNILGLRFESEGIIYDFTLDRMIDSKKDVLRQEVSKVLFG